MTSRRDISVPGDKSISHRAVMFASLARGRSTIRNFLMGADCLATVDAMMRMGVSIEVNAGTVHVQGVGLRGLRKPQGALDLKNSGTSIRLLLGILAGQDFEVTLIGDASLSNRPMRRVIDPLSRMGARITARDNNFPPMTVHADGQGLKGGLFHLPMPSAQVKSAILLAGLYAQGRTQLTEPLASRDHTERMLQRMGVAVTSKDNTITVDPCDALEPLIIDVPGDISSAAFMIMAALLKKNSDIVIRNVGLNPTRTGIISVLRRMGALIEIVNNVSDVFEPMGDIRVRSSELSGIVISEDDIPSLIDEIPILTVAAAFAKGETVITGAKELRVKESDRLAVLAQHWQRLGVPVKELPDGLCIQGVPSLQSAQVQSFGDHRIAMAMEIANLCSESHVDVVGKECVDVSFPGFYDQLECLKA